MNKVEQAICRIREKLPDNQGFVTLGVGCVVKNEELATSLGWKCPNLILTSSAVITPEHLALDRIFLAEFLVFEKKGFEVFDLKLSSEFCRTVSSRALSEEDNHLPNERLTVISTEPLDKRGFLKRMVRKSSLQTTRPIDCFNFQNFLNELSGDGIYCNVIREFGSLAQEFETRTYKFKQNDENHNFFLEDFGHQLVELNLQSFPADLQPLGGIIFSKLGAYLGCLGYGTSQIEPAFVPSYYLQAAETEEETQPEEEERKETELLVEGIGAVGIENKEDKLSTDENENEELQGESTGKDEHVPVEDTEEKATQEERENNNLEEQTLESNEQEEMKVEFSEEENIKGEKESGESNQIVDAEKYVSGEEAFPGSPETSEGVEPEEKRIDNESGMSENIVDTEKCVSGEEAFQGSPETSESIEQEEKRIDNESGMSENVEENVDVNKEEDVLQHEFVPPVESSEKERQDGEDREDILSDGVEAKEESADFEVNEPEKDNLQDSGDLISQDRETITLDNEEKKMTNDIKEQDSSLENVNEPSVTMEHEQAGVAMETSHHIDDGLGEDPKADDALEPGVSLPTVTEVRNSDDEICQPVGIQDEVRGTNDSLEAGTESSMVENNADIETDQVNTGNQVVGTDEEKVNKVKSVMEEDDNDNVLDNKKEAENTQHEETIEETPAPTLEEQLDMQLQKRRESKIIEIQAEGGKEENVDSQSEEKETLDKDTEISPEIIAEKDGNLEEKSVDDGEFSKTEETLKIDKPDGPEQEVEVLKLEPTQSPRKAEDDVGESLEPDALLSSTITNNPKVLDDLALLLDTEYQHGGVASWHDMALLLDIPKEAFDHCLSYSKSSPTESLMMFLSNTKPQFAIGDLKDSLRSIGRTDIVHILDRYIARSIVSDESVILGVVERDDTDLLGELALKLDRSGLQNWKSLSTQLEVPRKISKHFGSQQRQNPALLMLKYLPIFDPDLTVQSLKDACEAISKFDVVKFLDTSGVPGDDAIMDILEDTDIIDEVSDMLNDDEVPPNWRDLAKELKIPEAKFTIFEPAAKRSPTKLLLQSMEQCEPDITVEELILALVAMKRHDVIDMLYKHFKRSDIRTILEENNCLPPEPEKDVEEEKKGDDDAESFA